MLVSFKFKLKRKLCYFLQGTDILTLQLLLIKFLKDVYGLNKVVCRFHPN